MSYKVVVPKGSAPPLAPYSPGTKAGDAVYVSGTLALDSQGKLIGKGDVKAQTRHILYAAMNEVYREYFPVNPPARYCIRADLVKPELLVEIASIAHLDR
jgi:aminoacrylate peracid reductase